MKKIKILTTLLVITCSLGFIVHGINQKEHFYKQATLIREELEFYNGLQKLLATEYCSFRSKSILNRYIKSSPFIQSVKFYPINIKKDRIGWTDIVFDLKNNTFYGTCISPVYSRKTKKIIGYLVGIYRLDKTFSTMTKLKSAYIIDAEKKFVCDPHKKGPKKEKKGKLYREPFRFTYGWKLSF